MKKSQNVEIELRLSYKFNDTFPSDWDDELIKEYIEKHFKEFLQDDDNFEFEDIEILDSEVIEYEYE